MKADLYGRDVPRWLRLLGCFGIEQRGCFRFRWAEFSPSMGLALSLDHQSDDGHAWMLHIRLLIVQAFIYLPGPRREVRFGEMGESWGFSWNWGREWGNGDSIHLHWGYRFKVLHMPWGWDWVRSSKLLANGETWVHDLRGFRDHPIGTTLGENLGSRFLAFRDLPRWVEEYSYRYVLRSGEVQDRKAKITVNEMEWRWRALRWLPWPRKISRTIGVEFSDEVGERAGSWKGGCTGCSYELRYDETPVDCLRRMERERKF